LRFNPPPYPVSEPVDPITRWQGTMIATGFAPLAAPTAREAPASPRLLAIAP
jgi:outer membrane usher protein